MKTIASLFFPGQRLFCYPFASIALSKNSSEGKGAAAEEPLLNSVGNIFLKENLQAMRINILKVG
jgi:hypothetical protein